VTLGMRHFNDPDGMYNQPKAKQLTILALYAYEAEERKSARRAAETPAPTGIASADAAARARHFQVS